MDLKALGDFFDPQIIKWRCGPTSGSKGLALPYIDSRYIMGRLDAVCGVENWGDSYTPYTPHAEGNKAEDAGGLICTISIKINGEWVSKSDAANCTGMEEKLKGAATNSFKRAATKWRIGRYLYLFPQTWVPVEVKGSNKVLLETPEVPAWAIPQEPKEDQKSQRDDKVVTPEATQEEENGNPKEPTRKLTMKERASFLDQAAIWAETLDNYAAICDKFNTIPEEVTEYKTARDMATEFIKEQKTQNNGEIE